MDDLISRQAAIDAVEEYFGDLPIVVHYDMLQLIKKLPSAERRGRWIPITDRLPEEEGQYLISCDTDYGVEVGRFYIDEDGERYFGCDWNDPEDIEAWMPLPEPYKGGVERMSELDKLESYLKEHGYEYTRKDVDGEPYTDLHQIIVYKNGKRSWDAICHHGSYGYKERLLEIMGDIVWDDIDGDSVRGWLTADDVIARIKRGAEGARE